MLGKAGVRENWCAERRNGLWVAGESRLVMNGGKLSASCMANRRS